MRILVPILEKMCREEPLDHTVRDISKRMAKNHAEFCRLFSKMQRQCQIKVGQWGTE